MCGFALGLVTCPVYRTHLPQDPAYMRAASLPHLLAVSFAVYARFCVCGCPHTPPRKNARIRKQTRPKGESVTVPFIGLHLDSFLNTLTIARKDLKAHSYVSPCSTLMPADGERFFCCSDMRPTCDCLPLE